MRFILIIIIIIIIIINKNLFPASHTHTTPIYGCRDYYLCHTSKASTRPFSKEGNYRSSLCFFLPPFYHTQYRNMSQQPTQQQLIESNIQKLVQALCSSSPQDKLKAKEYLRTHADFVPRVIKRLRHLNRDKEVYDWLLKQEFLGLPLPTDLCVYFLTPPRGNLCHHIYFYSF